jgi:hypothetical protein
MCFGVEIDTNSHPNPHPRKGIKGCLGTAHDEICGRIKSESLRRCHKFTFPWRVREKRSKIKYKKKNGRENLNYNNDTWRAAGKWGTCQLTSTHHTTRALTITEQQRCGFFFFFFFKFDYLTFTFISHFVVND